MKKKIRPAFRALLLVLAISAAGCQKLIDKFHHGHGQPGNNCNITHIKQVFAYGNEVQRNGVFKYNGKGQPVSVIFDSLSGVSPWHFFEYDHHGRLIEFRSEWDHGREFYTAIHRYGYSSEGLITIDTAYLQVEGEFNVISHLEYDDMARIKKEVEYVLHPDNTTTYFREQSFQYDSGGNLILDGVSYDNKKSYLSTNEVWMFIHRNYSKNNPVGATQYNSSGLPLGFGIESNGAFLGYGNPEEITYKCK